MSKNNNLAKGSAGKASKGKSSKSKGKGSKGNSTSKKGSRSSRGKNKNQSKRNGSSAKPNQSSKDQNPKKRQKAPEKERSSNQGRPHTGKTGEYGRLKAEIQQLRTVIDSFAATMETLGLQPEKISKATNPISRMLNLISKMHTARLAALTIANECQSYVVSNQLELEYTLILSHENNELLRTLSQKDFQFWQSLVKKLDTIRVDAWSQTKGRAMFHNSVPVYLSGKTNLIVGTEAIGEEKEEKTLKPSKKVLKAIKDESVSVYLLTTIIS